MFDAAFAVIENETQRDELALFYQQYKNRLFLIALKNLHNECDAEDAIQEVFSDIADKPEKFFNIPTDKRLAYVDVMVRNISMKMFNKNTKVQTEPLSDEELEAESVCFDDLFISKVLHDEIVIFVNRLPTMQRNVLILRCLVGLSIDEISKRLDISLVNANKHLTRARKAVKKFIDERNDGK